MRGRERSGTTGSLAAQRSRIVRDRRDPARHRGAAV